MLGIGKRIQSFVQEKVEDALPSAYYRKSDSEPTLRIADAELRTLAQEIDKIDGDGNAAVQYPEIDAFRAKLAKYFINFDLGGLS